MDMKAVIPRRGISAAAGQASLDKWLTTLGTKTVSKLQKYPAAQPWKNPPKTGLRAGGKRTGNLGRGWKSSVNRNQSVLIENPITYASYVEGPSGKSGADGGQTDVMRARGWPNLTDVAKEALKETIAEVKLEASGPFGQ